MGQAEKRLGWNKGTSVATEGVIPYIIASKMQVITVKTFGREHTMKVQKGNRGRAPLFL
jgi:fructose-specific phosphotransferase system IIC component